MKEIINFFNKDKPWKYRGGGKSSDDARIIWLKEPDDRSLQNGTEQVCRLLATEESLTHVWLRGGGTHDTRTASDATGNHRVDDDDHLTVYCRKYDGQLLEGHVYCVIDGQSGRFMEASERRHAQPGKNQPVELYHFKVSEGRRERLREELLKAHDDWCEKNPSLSQQST